MRTEHYTPSGERALTRAWRTAKNCGGRLLPRHLLVGALAEECIPGRLLERWSGLPERLERMVLKEGAAYEGDPVCSPEAAQVLRRACALAGGTVAPRHLL